MMMRDAKLEPCPYCNSKNIFYARGGEEKIFVYCSNCGSMTEDAKTLADAVDKWNKKEVN